MSIYLKNLRACAETYKVSDICAIVLDDPRFDVCSGSSKPGQHHYGDGGLAQHTWEVVHIALHNMRWYHEYEQGDGWVSDDIRSKVPFARETFLAGLFHDCGKMWDYQKIDGVWQGSPHKRTIHHISRSAIEWSKAVEKTNSCKDVEENVLHAILAHHGRREWGSPVAPKSRLAWLLHLSDGISARMNDADTLDIIR